MDLSNGQHQDISSLTMDNMLVCSKPGQDKKPRPHPDQALKCPRCDSTNTKFCYYNNYSLSQPRYFCKSCRRYWTKGGTLRNVPVGGGCRKNKRSCSSSKRGQDQPLMQNASNLSGLPSLSYDTNDLSLAFARLQKQSGGHLIYDQEQDLSMFGNLGDHVGGCSGLSSPANAPFIDAIRNSFVESQSKLLQNLYYNNESGEMGFLYEDMINGGAAQAVSMTTMKQEHNDNESRILWGFPWQQVNGGNVIMGGGGGGGGGGDFDTGRESWNGLNPTWHGLVNTALM